MTENSFRPGHASLRAGRWSESGRIYHVTAVTEQRETWFANPNSAKAASAAFCEPSVLRDSTLLAWVLMPDHAHWLLQIGDADELSECMVRLKSASARAANKMLDRQGGLWARGFHDRAIRREEDIKSVARYIVANPLRAGLVNKIEDYPYWDAAWVERSGVGLD